MKESHFEKEAEFDKDSHFEKEAEFDKDSHFEKEAEFDKEAQFGRVSKRQTGRQEDRRNTWTNVLTLLAGKGFLGLEVSHQGALDLCGLKDSGFLKDAPWTTHMLYHESCA